jgi:hypothetical protein
VWSDQIRAIAVGQQNCFGMSKELIDLLSQYGPAAVLLIAAGTMELTGQARD